MIRLIDLLKEVTTKISPVKLLTKQSSGGKTLILIPGAGGKASDFTTLIKNLKKDFSIYTIEFGKNFDAPEFAAKITNELSSNKDIVKFAVGGYSIGGAIAWHLAKKLKELKLEKFNNQLFWIDSGIPNSTAEFIAGIKNTSTNPPRYAIAFNLTHFKKSRNGEVMKDEEVDKNRKVFWTKAELIAWKKDNKGKFLDYTENNKFPPSNDELDKQAKIIKQTNPWIIEDKYDKTNFNKRYSNAVMFKANVSGKSFLDGDTIVTNASIDYDAPPTRSGRESGDPKNPILPALSGVQIISIAAGLTKDGLKRSDDEKEKKKKEDSTASDSKNNDIVFIDATHENIVESPKLAELIKSKFSG